MAMEGTASTTPTTAIDKALSTKRIRLDRGFGIVPSNLVSSMSAYRILLGLMLATPVTAEVPSAVSITPQVQQAEDVAGDERGSDVGELNVPQGELSIDDALDRRGSITFRKTPLQEVVFLLSDLWQINIVVGEKVTGEVSGIFKDAPLRDVLSAVLTSSGYSYKAAGQSLIVLPIDEVGTSSLEFVSKTLPLRTKDDAQRDSTIEAAKLLLSDRGRIQAFGGNSVLVVDSPDRVVAVEKMLIDLRAAQQIPGGATGALTPPAADGGSPDENQVLGAVGMYRPRIAYFTPQFTEASEMAEALKEAFGG